MNLAVEKHQTEFLREPLRPLRLCVERKCCEIEYRIIGVNTAGISIPSNTASVVL